MTAVATTKMSSKGQIVIPEEVRKMLDLKTGTQFIVIGEGDAVTLKSISPPKVSEFSSLLDKAQTTTKEAGMKKSDIDDAIKTVRKSRKTKAK
jgi:AbrB family looped-hinge helix DNA binding protein